MIDTIQPQIDQPIPLQPQIPDTDLFEEDTLPVEPQTDTTTTNGNMIYPDKDRVRVIIPTFNEEISIGDLLSRLHALNYKNITVIDGNSTDKTKEIVEQYKDVKFITQIGKGKGKALRQAFETVEEPYILMLDADGTNPPECGIDLLKHVFNGYDHVIGNRLNSYETGAFKSVNLAGNAIFNQIFEKKTGYNMQDILSGFRAFRTDAVRQLNLKSDGFEIETELCLETIKHNLKWITVDTTYKARKTGSKSNLHPFRDGKKIFDFIMGYQL